MLAIFGDLAFSELLLIAAVALMVFGKRLPEVAVRAAAHVTRLRRSLTEMWREAGIEDELRKVRRDVERTMPDLRNPRKMVRDIGAGYLDKVDKEIDAEKRLATPDPEPDPEKRPQPPVDQREEQTGDPDEDRESA